MNRYMKTLNFICKFKFRNKYLTFGTHQLPLNFLTEVLWSVGRNFTYFHAHCCQSLRNIKAQKLFLIELGPKIPLYLKRHQLSFMTRNVFIIPFTVQLDQTNEAITYYNFLQFHLSLGAVECITPQMIVRVRNTLIITNKLSSVVFSFLAIQKLE